MSDLVLNTIATNVATLTTAVGQLTTKVDTVTEKVDKVTTTVDKLSTTVNKVTENLGTLTTTVGKLGGTVDRVVNKLVDLDYYVRENMFTKEQAQETESRLMSHIDGFIKLNQTVNEEQTALRSYVKRLETRVEETELKLGLASS